MVTCAEADVQSAHPTRQPEDHVTGFSSSDVTPSTDKFQNVGLYPHYGGGNSDGSNTAVLPLRPYAGDCPHYLKTGFCKFGTQCRYNHPVKKTGVVVIDKARDSGGDAHHVECKYYLTAGGCKYGSFCRYSHSKDGSGNAAAAPLHNFLGLPMRMGEKECPYYMRHGSCGYGAQCVFHHPEPLSVEKPNDKSLRQSGYSMRSRDYEPVPLQLTDDSKPPEEHWFLQHPGLNQYQAPEVPYQRSTHAPLTLGGEKAYMVQPSGDIEDYPERPGHPECVYFMKTGYCRFKSTCRYHHPKGQPKTILSEKGLPLRPGRSICRHYERFSVCKFGLACLFDHPVNHYSLNSQDWSSAKPASDHYGGTWAK